MNSLTLSAVLIFLTRVVNAQVLEPVNTTVLQNTDARFNCSMKNPGWTAMTWIVNTRFALLILEVQGPGQSNASFSATNYSTAGEYKWELLMKGVTAANAGQVQCQVLNNLPVYATLNVQQNGTVAISGSNLTATEGDQVTFQCLAAGWLPAAQLSWAINGTPVDKGLYNTSSVANGTLMNSNSTLKFNAKGNVSVDCLASISTLPSPQISTVFLTSHPAVPQPPRNQTVLIAITVAFSLAALLALLIILIVFCCKRRRKKRSRYQAEVRARSLSNRRQAAYAERGRVRENFGYVDDSPSVDNRDGVYTIGDYRRSNIQVPRVNSNRYFDGSSYDGYSLDDPTPQTHRHLTLV